jgi:sortase A
MRRFLSIILIAAGAFLTFQGARDFLESRFGQSVAARDFGAFESLARAGSATPQPGTVRARDPVAKLVIPRLEAQLYVVEGVDEKDLRRGPGHMAGTVMPGAEGNCVIAGHRDTHFRVLKDIRKGDDILLETGEGQFLYRVKQLRVVSPRNTQPLQPTAGPVLNLITCYPFYYVGAAPKRFVVEATLAGAVTASAPQSTRRSGS